MCFMGYKFDMNLGNLVKTDEGVRQFSGSPVKAFFV